MSPPTPVSTQPESLKEKVLIPVDGSQQTDLTSADAFARQMYFWAKLGKGTYPDDMHPVVCHLVDVGYVAKALWSSAIGQATRDRWSGQLCVDPEAAGLWIAFWAAAHDIGKLTPAFQFRCIPAKQRLSALGLTAGPATNVPHGLCSAAILKAELTTERPGIRSAIPGLLAAAIAKVVGGHHGVIPTTLDLRQARSGLGSRPWEAARIECLSLVADALQLSQLPVPVCPAGIGNAFHMFLAGLVAVADWIGSNLTFFTPAGPRFSTGSAWCQYLVQAADSADRAVRELGFSRWTPGKAGQLAFCDVHPKIKLPRPLQQSCVQISAACTQPQLVLIEAPMGEGKTEAAVYLADHATHVLGLRGMFIALPSQATANQMFSRVHGWLESRYTSGSDSQRINLQLAHGRSGYSAEYVSLLNLAAIEEDAGVGSTDEGGGNDAPIVVAETWFAQGRKQQILAPFGVGTVDQILLGILRTRHHFVRLFGLSGKTVILDEVHAYDAYMSTLLERLVAWLASLGCAVVLLSATLPAARRQRLVQAYSGQPFTPGTCAYPRITVASIGAQNPQQISFMPDPGRSMNVCLKWVEESVLITSLKTALAEGGCCVVICNTVRRCQMLHQQLAAEFEADCFEMLMFHSRFTVADRIRVENAVVSRLGPPERVAQRPDRLILLATQVVEQSLDLDFDLMVSEVAPVDLVLQRLGRLHRHRRSHRPAKLRQPSLWLLRPETNDNGIPGFRSFGSSVAANGTYRDGVYDRHILLRSWLALGGQTNHDQSLMIPNDIDRLVNVVYEEESAAVTADQALRDELEVSAKAMLGATAKSEAAAAGVRIRSAEACDLLEVSSVIRDEDDPTVHADLKASTRESDPSVLVILLWKHGDSVAVSRHGSQCCDLDGPHLNDRNQVDLLLRNAITIADRYWTAHFLRQAVPRSWRKCSALCFSRAMTLDESGCYRFADRYIKYDSVFGLSYGYISRETDNGNWESQN